MYRSTKTLITDCDKSLSIVNFVLDQSQDAPSFFSCSSIIPPYFSFHFHACFKNSSLDNESLSIPFSFSMATTLASVAIEAWSVPGTQHASFPFILALLVSMSWIELLSICPMCRTPVTFGGGITIVKGSLSGFGDDLKHSSSSHFLYHLSSIFWGLYFESKAIT